MSTDFKRDFQQDRTDARDSELLRLYVKERSDQAFAELGRRYVKLIYGTCLRELGDRTLAEDATQGVFLLLSQKAPTLCGQETLAGWLYSASRYVAKNLTKQEQRRKLYEARALSEQMETKGENNPLWESIEPHFYDVLNRLRAPDREAILLRFVQEQSLAEVGANLGISENTARMRINRALEKVRTHLNRIGIAVSVTALIALLETRSEQPAPASMLPGIREISAQGGVNSVSQTVSSAVRRTSLQISLRRASLRLVQGISAAMIVAIVAYLIMLPQQVGPAEQHRFFATLTGTWQGRLTFADDKTRQQFTYPTSVWVSLQQDTLRFTAGYTGSSRVDITTITRNPQTGAITVDTGGEKSSHLLSSVGSLFRESGGMVFQGFNAGTRRDTRLHLWLRQNQFTLQEEFRLPQSKAYLFRNRFVLTKK